MPCRVASRSCSSAAISGSSSPNVWRLSRRQQERGDDPDREGDRGVGEDGGQQRQQPAGDPLLTDADRHLADDAPVRRAEGHLATCGAAKRAGLDRRDRLPGKGGGRIGADPLADLGRVGMGVADATIVGDHDEERAALPPDGLGPSLDQAVRVAVHDRLGDPGIGGHGLGHPQRLLLE